MQRRRRRAVRRLRLGRRVARRDRQRLDALEAALLAAKAVTDKPSLLVLRIHIGYPSPDHTDDHEAHGNPFTAEQVTRTKEVMGIPDEPFWSPAELVEAYRGARARARRRRARAGEAARREPQRRAAAWDATWAATGLPGWAASLPTFEQGEKIATRKAIEKAWTRRRPVAGPRRRRRRPHRQHRHQAGRARSAVGEEPRRPPGLLRRPRARDGRGDGRHGAARRRPSRRRHVLRLPRLHAPAGPPRCAVARQGRCSCSLTTRSASARTDRPISRSSTSPRCARSPTCR